MSNRSLGEALTDELAIDGGAATIHQHGFSLRGDGVTATAWWGLLGIGRPVMVSGDPAAAMVMIWEVEAEGPGSPWRRSPPWCGQPSPVGSCSRSPRPPGRRSSW